MNQKIVLTIVSLIAVQSLSTTFGCFAQIEDDQNESESNGETDISLDLPSIFPIVRVIKGQIKEIVIDLAMQVFRCVWAITQDIKVRLLKRLGKYTLSDCFHTIFDGVVEFVNEEPSESNDSEATTETTTKMTTTVKLTTEKTTTEKATTPKATIEMVETKTSTTTTTAEESNEDENDSKNNSRSILYENPYMWYYK